MNEEHKSAFHNKRLPQPGLRCDAAPFCGDHPQQRAAQVLRGASEAMRQIWRQREHFGARREPTAKSVLDADWSSSRTVLRHKGNHANAPFAQGIADYLSRTCLSVPYAGAQGKGRAARHVPHARRGALLPPSLTSSHARRFPTILALCIGCRLQTSTR